MWGWGTHAKKQVVPAILISDAFDLAAIISRGFEKPEFQTIDHGRVYFCTEHEVLSNAEIDTVYVATPNGLHHQHCLEALKAGKNVLCEKSLTTSLGHSLELITLARRQKVFLGEAFMYLFHPQYVELKRLLSSGALGKLSTITCEFGVPLLDRPGFRRNAALGGGAFWDVACYQLSLVTELFDPAPEVLKAYVEKSAGGESAADEGGTVLLRLQSGAYAFFTWGYSRSYRNHLMVWGDSGSVAVDHVFSKAADYNSRIETYDQFGKQSDLVTGRANAFVNMLNNAGSRMDRGDYQEECLAAAERQALAMHSVLSAS